MEEVCEGKDFSFPKAEEEVLKFWDEIDAFKQQLKRTEGKPEYIFYDGPPFATGLPHYGHILAGTIKDVVTRYASSNGFHVERRFGWDCHGLPVEYEIDQKLGITGKDDVMKMGIDVYNEECRSIVMRYSKEWEKTVHRLGRWIDFENDYKTLDPTFMESVWWVFKTLFDKGLVYRGFKVMPYSTTCSTPLSNFEAGLNYKDVADPAVMVSFPIVGDAEGAALVAWTTTPWTLPSNLALCVNPEFVYVRARDPKTSKVYIVAKSRLPAIPGAVPKKGKKDPGWEVLSEVLGKDLAGVKYEPLFPYYSDLDTCFRVCTDGYVTDDSGTGVVHQAPAFGEDDYRVCIAHGIIAKGEKVPCPVSDNGRFEEPVADFLGQYVKDADKNIIAKIKETGRLVDNATLMHSYPFCWRSDTPLIYKAVPSWFVKVEEIKEKILANNAKTYWVPSYVKEKRFHNWLEGAHDWAVSRSRYWGTPLPIWISDDLEEVVVVGSIAELEELTGTTGITDIHRHFIDQLTIPSKQGKGVLRRVEDVFDCWFESGSMPYGQQHYPFENKEKFESNFPANFIAEGLDQTRGWFYTLMVLSTALFDKPAFQNLICNGLVLASDGKKMSKRLKNYPDPSLVIDKYGSDALRLYLVNSPVVRAEPLRFQEDGVFQNVKGIFLPWYNAYRFLAQNAIVLAAESGTPFSPADVSLAAATNVLDRWIIAATSSLVRFTRQEMEAYRLYTVAPRLVQFIDELTNIYVRFNRKRLKGKGGAEDQRMALATLHHVLTTLCKAMAPYTPFFTEHMYQNLRRVIPGAPESLHFCDFPADVEPAPGDARIQESVGRMQKVIDLARNIRERHNVKVKVPVREMVVVHPDEDFLEDLRGELAEYVAEEMNVRGLTTCSDPAKYCTVRAEPEWKVLGKRVGKDMGKVAKAVQALDAAALEGFEATGTVEVAGHTLQEGDIKVVRDFNRPAGKTEEQVDAAGDGEVLVVLDLEADQELVDAGMAREIVNRFQKLRKAAGCIASDRVALFFAPPAGEAAGAVMRVLAGHQAYMAEALGTTPAPTEAMPAHAVTLGSEEVTVADGAASFTAVLCRATLVFTPGAMEAAAGGDASRAAGLAAWLLSRDPAGLAAEAEAAGGKVTVHLDGKACTVALGKDFSFGGPAPAPAAAAAAPAATAAGKKKKGGAPVAPAAPSAGGADAKKLAKCKKEGGKKAQDICGMCDMGGVYYYTLGMDECENSWELMQACMDGANTPVAPDAEERKGGADHLGKMFMGFNDDELIIFTNVPKGEKTAALNAADWCSAVCSADGVGGVLLPGADAVWAKAVVKGDKANGKFPIKIKDLAISASISLLRSKQLLPDDEGSDDDVNYGEDLEW